MKIELVLALKKNEENLEKVTGIILFLVQNYDN
jgi:hypothetical protein